MAKFRVEAPWRHNRFFLPEGQLTGSEPLWLNDYKDGIEKFFQQDYQEANTNFQNSIQKGCPPTVYVWLMSCNPYLEEEVDYKDKLTPEILEGWAISTVAEEKNALAICYSFGIIRGKGKEALSSLEEAARQGYAVAQVNMGNIEFQKGNLTKAAEYYQAAANQDLPCAQYLLSTLQKSIHLRRTRAAGSWLLYPIGLLSMLLAIGFGGLAAYLDPLWFANFSHVFGGIFLTAGLVSAVGAVVWAIGGLLALPEFIWRLRVDFETKKEEAALSDPPRHYNFLHYMFEGFSLRSSVKLLLFVVPLVIIVALMQVTDFTSILSDALLSGLTALAGIPGLDFLSPLLTSAFTQAAVEMFCILSPLILYAAGNRVVATFRSENQQEIKLNRQEDRGLERRTGTDSAVNPHQAVLPKNHESAQKTQLREQAQIYSNEDHEQETQDGIPVVLYEYTPEQEEYRRNNVGRYLVRALYPYTPAPEDPGEYHQLTFKTGDLIWVLDNHPEEDWWMGEMADSEEKGYFPTNFVQVLKPTVTKNVQEVGADMQGSGVFGAGVS